MKALTNKLLVGVVSAVSVLALAAPPALAAGLSSSFSVTPGSDTLNHTQMYTITVNNTGDVDITQVIIHAPSNLTFTGFVDLPADDGYTDSLYTYSTQTIPVGESGNYFINGLSDNANSTGYWLVQTSAGEGVQDSTAIANTLIVGEGAPVGLGSSLSDATSAITPAPSDMFGKALSVAPIVALGVLVFFFLALLRGLVSGLNKGKTKLSVGYGAGPERTDLIKGIKSGKYHG